MLVDISLPGIDGYEVARRIKMLPNAKTMVVAALTGYGLEEDRRRAHAAGFDLHLVKPVKIEYLQFVSGSAHRSAARLPIVYVTLLGLGPRTPNLIHTRFLCPREPDKLAKAAPYCTAIVFVSYWLVNVKTHTSVKTRGRRGIPDARECL